MIRLGKWIGIIVAALVLLAVLAVLLLPTLLNFERYQSLLVQRASRALGREVTLGALRVNLWGGLGAEARGVAVAQAAGVGGAPLLTAEALQVRVEFLPLLRGRIKVASLLLDRPQVRILRDPDGRWSFEDLLRSPSPPTPGRPAPEGPRGGRGPAAAGLVVSELAVRDGEILLAGTRAPAGAGLRLTGIELRLRQEAAGDPIRFTVKGSLGEGKGGGLEASGSVLPGGAGGPEMDLGLRLREVDVTPWRNLAADLFGADLSGRVSGELKVSGPPEKAAFSGDLDLTPLGIRIGGALEKPEREAAGLTFRGRREGAGLEVGSLRLALGGMTAEATARIPDLARPHLTFTLTSPLVEVERLLPRPKKTAAIGSGLAWAASAPRAAPPAPAGFSAGGTLRIGELRYAGLAWLGVEGELAYGGGLLRARKVRAALLDGRIELDAEVDLRPRTIRVDLTSRAAGLPTEPLVKALRLGAWTLQSRLDLEARLSFAGLSLAEFLGSATGQGSVALGEGQLGNYRPLERLGEVVAPFLAAQGLRLRLHEFQGVSGQYTLDKGVLRTRDLTLKKQEGTVTAAGALGLLDKSLDFDVTARLGRTLVEAKLTGTTGQPIVVPKLGRLQRKLETEVEKLVPEGQRRGLKDLFQRLFPR